MFLSRKFFRLKYYFKPLVFLFLSVMAKIAGQHFNMNHLITLITEIFNKAIQYIQKQNLQKKVLQRFKFLNPL